MTYTSATTSQRPFTLDDMRRAADVLRDMPPEPIGEWMREQGMPPSLYTLFLPSSMRPAEDALWPSYVHFSDLIERPVFVRRESVTYKPAQLEAMKV